MPARNVGASTGAPPRPQRRLLGLVFLVLIYAAAVPLLLIPALFLALGLQALGSRWGLWVGEPTSNDGEESWATMIGILSFLVVLAGAACGAWPVAKRHGMKPLWTVTIATGAVVLGYALLMAAFLR